MTMELFVMCKNREYMHVLGISNRVTVRISLVHGSTYSLVPGHGARIIVYVPWCVEQGAREEDMTHNLS